MRTLLLSLAVLGTSLGLLVASGESGRAQSGQKVEVKPKAPEEKRGAQKFKGRALFDWMNELKKQEKSHDPSLLVEPIAVLKIYGKDAREVVPEIIKALRNTDVSVRVNAAITLGYIGLDEKDREAGVNGLRAMLRNDSQGIARYQAACALSRLGQQGIDAQDAVPELINALLHASSTWEIRNAAANALGRVGFDYRSHSFDGKAFHALLYAASNDRCAEVRYESLLSLILFGTPGLPADLKLEKERLATLGRYGKQPPKVAIWANVAYMRIAGVSQQHLATIARYLKDPDMTARVHAGRALSLIGREAKSTIPDLIPALEDKELEVRTWVCAALSNMGPDARAALPALNRMKVEDPDANVRAAAAKTTELIKEGKKVN